MASFAWLALVALGTPFLDDVSNFAASIAPPADVIGGLGSSMARASSPVLRPQETARMAAPQTGGQTTSRRQERRRSTRETAVVQHAHLCTVKGTPLASSEDKPTTQPTAGMSGSCGQIVNLWARRREEVSHSEIEIAG
jgi:hypothetical protein